MRRFRSPFQAMRKKKCYRKGKGSNYNRNSLPRNCMGTFSVRDRQPWLAQPSIRLRLFMIPCKVPLRSVVVLRLFSPTTSSTTSSTTTTTTTLRSTTTLSSTTTLPSTTTVALFDHSCIQECRGFLFLLHSRYLGEL